MNTKPLTTCPACGSTLIYPRACEPFGDDHALVHRRCPGCEHVDRVLATSDAVAVWDRLQARRLIELAGDLLVLEVEGWLAEQDRLAPETP